MMGLLALGALVAIAGRLMWLASKEEMEEEAHRG